MPHPCSRRCWFLRAAAQLHSWRLLSSISPWRPLQRSNLARDVRSRLRSPAACLSWAEPEGSGVPRLSLYRTSALPSSCLSVVGTGVPLILIFSIVNSSCLVFGEYMSISFVADSLLFFLGVQKRNMILICSKRGKMKNTFSCMPFSTFLYSSSSRILLIATFHSLWLTSLSNNVDLGTKILFECS